MFNEKEIRKIGMGLVLDHMCNFPDAKLEVKVNGNEGSMYVVELTDITNDVIIMDSDMYMLQDETYSGDIKTLFNTIIEENVTVKTEEAELNGFKVASRFVHHLITDVIANFRIDLFELRILDDLEKLTNKYNKDVILAKVPAKELFRILTSYNGLPSDELHAKFQDIKSHLNSFSVIRKLSIPAVYKILNAPGNESSAYILEVGIIVHNSKDLGVVSALQEATNVSTGCLHSFYEIISYLVGRHMGMICEDFECEDEFGYISEFFNRNHEGTVELLEDYISLVKVD